MSALLLRTMAVPHAEHVLALASRCLPCIQSTMSEIGWKMMGPSSKIDIFIKPAETAYQLTIIAFRTWTDMWMNNNYVYNTDRSLVVMFGVPKVARPFPLCSADNQECPVEWKNTWRIHIWTVRNWTIGRRRQHSYLVHWKLPTLLR